MLIELFICSLAVTLQIIHRPIRHGSPRCESVVDENKSCALNKSSKSQLPKFFFQPTILSLPKLLAVPKLYWIRFSIVSYSGLLEALAKQKGSVPLEL